MDLHEELGDVVRKWRALTKREIRDWELKAIDLKNAVQEGDQRFSDLQDEHKDVLDRNRKLEAVMKAAKFARSRLALLGHKPSSDVGMAFSRLQKAITDAELEDGNERTNAG